MHAATTFVTPSFTFFLLTLAPAPATAPEPDIRCEAKGHYTGNLISPTFNLSIAGPKEKTWVYTYFDTMSGSVKEPPVHELKGTYELKDGLVIFTGTGTTRANPRAPAQEFR